MTRSLLAFILFALTFPLAAEPPAELQPALAAITPEGISARMRFLADDLLEGRGTGTRGYDIAARYVASEFEELGLEPLFNGEWLQPVPFRLSTIEEAFMVITSGRGIRRLVWGEDFVSSGHPAKTSGAISAPVVYAGYGITAPELERDDYASVDVEGKIVAILRGAPSSFPNHLRTYYSSTSGKRDNALAHGAAGILFFQTPSEAKRFPYDRARQHAKEPSVSWLQDDGLPHGERGRLVLEAAISQSGAEHLFVGSGRPLSEILDDAERGETESIELPATLSFTQKSRHALATSPNVGAVLRGNRLPDEAFVYVAHLDHVGVVPNGDDSIYNGAYDNASGIAAMLEVARAFTAAPRRPDRSIIFLAVTAEEKGLLGAEYFTHHPPLPIENIVGNVSLDMFLMLHPLRDIVAYGAEHSTLGPAVERAAAMIGARVSPDYAPEEVIFIRSDQFRFVQKGIPSMMLSAGTDTGDPDLDGRAAIKQWLSERYHRAGDDMSQPMVFEAGAAFARINFLLGWDVANAEERPRWNEGDFFGMKFGGNAGQRSR